MTDLNSNAHVDMCAGGIVADLDVSSGDTIVPETIGARQARLAEAMCETFFWQLKLINTAVIELPFGWLRLDTDAASPGREPEAEPILPSASDSPPESHAMTLELAPSPSTLPSIAPSEFIAPSESATVDVVPVAQRTAYYPAKAGKPPRKSKASRKKPIS